MRDVGLASAEVSIYTGGRKGKAELEIKYEKALSRLNDELVQYPIYGKDGKIVQMWKQAEELLFNISLADGRLSMNDLWRMNVYEFMRYKQMLTKHIKEKQKRK